jgi:DNA-binding LacI/PurR family transcriptional regulator
VCVWVYGLFTDVPGDFVKKPMRDCTGKEITQEWLYHIGVPVEQLAAETAKMLFSLISGKEEPCSKVYDGELVVRESTKSRIAQQ